MYLHRSVPLFPASGYGPSIMNCDSDCATRNVVYIAHCVQCFSFYVGKTNRTLRERIRDHEYCLRRQQDCSALAKHTLTAGDSHTFLYQVIQVLDTNLRGGNIINLTEQAELGWICRLAAHRGKGLNEVLSIKPHLKGRRLK